MALQMLDSADPIRVKNLSLHVFADPGVGRTTLGNTGDKALLGDFDLGVHRSLGRQKVARLEAWEEMEELLEHPWFEECGLFVVDTVGRALELLTASILSDSKMGSRGVLNQPGWGVLRTRFTQFFSEVRRRGKHVLMLSHAKLDRDKEGNKTAIPDIQGGSAGEVFKVSDAMAYMEIKNGKRYLDFNITDYHLGKNPAGWAPLHVPDYDKAPRFLHEGVIVPLLKHLNTLSEEQTVVVAEVGKWAAKVEGLDADPVVFTSMIASLERIEHPAVKAQIKTLLWRRATKALGFEFDKDAKEFKAKAKGAA